MYANLKFDPLVPDATPIICDVAVATKSSVITPLAEIDVP
jgi:hypothetical protein